MSVCVRSKDYYFDPKDLREYSVCIYMIACAHFIWKLGRDNQKRRTFTKDLGGYQFLRIQRDPGWTDLSKRGIRGTLFKEEHKLSIIYKLFELQYIIIIIINIIKASDYPGKRHLQNSTIELFAPHMNLWAPFASRYVWEPITRKKNVAVARD